MTFLVYAGAAMIIAIVFAAHLYPRAGADRVAHAYDWNGCGVVEPDFTGRAVYAEGWQGVESAAFIEGTFLCEFLMYARFRRAADLDAAIATLTRDDSYCVAGYELVTTIGLRDDDRFADMCDEIRGVLHPHGGLP